MRRVHYKVTQFTEGQMAGGLRSRYELLCAMRNKVLDNEQETQVYLTKVAKYLTNQSTKQWLFLLGGVGTGKTTMALAIKKTLDDLTFQDEYGMAHRISTAMASAEDLTSEEVQRAIWTSRFVIVDDLGQEALEVKEYGNSRMPFVELVGKRYEENKPLIVTSNLTMKDIAERYGERTADRIKEMAEIIKFNGNSYRV